MTMIKKLSRLAVAVLALTITASGMAQGFDLFSIPRATVLMPPTILTQTSNTDLLFTNSAIDVRDYDGVGAILLSVTNTAGTLPKIYTYIQGSSDNTNWTTLSTLATATATSESLTNASFPVAVKVTQSTLIPGTITVATPATAGFAGTYLTPAAFTADNVCTNTPGGGFLSGIVLRDAPRYLRLMGTVTGSNSVFVAGSVLLGRKVSGVY